MNKVQQKAFEEWRDDYNICNTSSEYITYRLVESAFEAGLNYKRKTGTKEQKESASNVIVFLNEIAHRNFPCNETNLGIVISRLKEGYTEDQLRQVIVRRGDKWNGDDKTTEWMRPKTLFNKTNFGNYVGELV